MVWARMEGSRVGSPCQIINGNGVSLSSSSPIGLCELGSATAEVARDPRVSSFLDSTIAQAEMLIRWILTMLNDERRDVLRSRHQVTSAPLTRGPPPLIPAGHESYGATKSQLCFCKTHLFVHILSTAYNRCP